MLLQVEGPYGFSELYWDASAVVDGTYELRARTVCDASLLTDPPAGMDEAVSEVVVGVMDRVAPRRFGLYSEPADGIYAPGDEISVTFDEPIVSCSAFEGCLSNSAAWLSSLSCIRSLPVQDCRQPYNFFVDMSLMQARGRTMEFDEDQVQIVCHDKKLAIEFAPTVAFDTLQQTTAVHVAVRGVRDLIGNPLENPEVISWHFTVSSTIGAARNECVHQSYILTISPFTFVKGFPLRFETGIR